jgi:hypothetical protein
MFCRRILVASMELASGLSGVYFPAVKVINQSGRI